MIKSKVEIKLQNPELIKKILSNQKRQRSDARIVKKEGGVEIIINAEDITAYKATLSQYLKLVETALNAMKVK